MANKITKNKYIHVFLLHAFGDTFGFKNGEWEFYEDHTLNSIQNKINELIALGGLNQINLKTWYVSDDTIFHMAIGKSLISTYKSLDVLENNTIIELLDAYEQIKHDENNKNRLMGLTTKKYIEQLKLGNDWKSFKYDNNAGGNGCAMRTLCIGLAFHGSKNRDKLIRYSINSSKMTHPNPIGWLGGLCSAMFVAFVIENIDIKLWTKEFIKIIKDYDIRNKYCSDNVDELASFELFINKISEYDKMKFTSDNKIQQNKSMSNMSNRIIFYNDFFGQGHRYAKSGLSCIIIAYDCLLDSGKYWEKLVYYTMMNNFDTDTLGCIACGLYGILYGDKHIPNKNVKYLEYKDVLINIANEIYKKYN